MEGKSYLNNLITFCGGMTSSVDEERTVNIVYLNLSKTFPLRSL